MRRARVTDPTPRLRAERSECTTLKPDPDVWARVMEITGGEVARVVQHSPTSVVVYNTEEQAKAARKRLKR